MSEFNKDLEQTLEILYSPLTNLRDLANLSGHDIFYFFNFCDLSQIDLSGQNLCGLNFLGADFSGSNLDGRP